MSLGSPEVEIGNPAGASPGSALDHGGESAQSPSPVRREPGAASAEKFDPNRGDEGAGAPVVRYALAPGEPDDWEARALAERLWQRDPLAFLAVCAGATARGTTLLARIRQRVRDFREKRP